MCPSILVSFLTDNHLWIQLVYAMVLCCVAGEQGQSVGRDFRWVKDITPAWLKASYLQTTQGDSHVVCPEPGTALALERLSWHTAGRVYRVARRGAPHRRRRYSRSRRR